MIRFHSEFARNRRVDLCGLLLAFSILASLARANTFFSGLVDVDATVAGGNNVTGANRISAASGFGYNNNWAPAIAPGIKVTSLGFVGMTAATSGATGTTQGLGTFSHGLVAVYAQEGLTIPVGGSLLALTFDPSDGIVPGGTLPGSVPGGVLRVYDRSSLTPNSIDANDPTTWIPGNPALGTAPGGINEGLVAEVVVTHRADGGYQRGLPLAQTTLFTPLDVSRVNQFVVDLNDAFAGTEGDLKFAFTDLFNVLGVDANSLFKNLAVDPGNADLVRTSLDLVANVDQEIITANFPTLNNLTNVDDANALFDALLDAVFGAGNHLFSGNGGSDGPGSDFDNGQNGNNIAVGGGDTAPIIAGATMVPGGQFTQVNPEPATIAVWSLVALMGVAATKLLRCPLACNVDLPLGNRNGDR